jgi:hypothetical protein
LQNNWNPIEAVLDTFVFCAVIMCAVMDIVTLQSALAWNSGNGAEGLKEEQCDPEDAEEKYSAT